MYSECASINSTIKKQFPSLYREREAKINRLYTLCDRLKAINAIKFKYSISKCSLASEREREQANAEQPRIEMDYSFILFVTMIEHKYRLGKYIIMK